jgi:transcriptional regulator with XRE-family HTH domain
MAASTHHDDYRLLLTVLKEARHASKVTQIDLAGRLGTTQTLISKVERGERRLDVVELIEVLEELGVSPQAWLKDFLARRASEHRNHKTSRKISS